VLVLDSGAVSRMAERSRYAAALIQALRDEGLWPPVVPTVVLVECLQGHAGRDALANRFLKMCDLIEDVPEASARRAARGQDLLSHDALSERLRRAAPTCRR
jgi:hypothetical protein